MNINDELPCIGEPVEIRVSRGRLRCTPPYSDNELEFTQIEGRLISVSKTKWHGFPYWRVILKDEVNTYHLLFFLRSAMFVYLVRCLIGRKINQLSIMVGMLSDGTYQMIVETDGRRVEPRQMDVPPTRRYRKSKDNKHDYKDYGERLEFLQKLVNEIGATHMHT